MRSYGGQHDGEQLWRVATLTVHRPSVSQTANSQRTRTASAEAQHPRPGAIESASTVSPNADPAGWIAPSLGSSAYAHRTPEQRNGSARRRATRSQPRTAPGGRPSRRVSVRGLAAPTARAARPDQAGRRPAASAGRSRATPREERPAQSGHASCRLPTRPPPLARLMPATTRRSAPRTPRPKPSDRYRAGKGRLVWSNTTRLIPP
jgi:hypothetical protein